MYREEPDFLGWRQDLWVDDESVETRERWYLILFLRNTGSRYGLKGESQGTGRNFRVK